MFCFILAIVALLVSLCSSSFSPKDLLSAPRASAAIPNPNGTLAAYSQTTYSFDTDSRSGGIYLLPIATKSSPKLIINDTNASDPVWLDNHTVLYIYTKSGESSLRTYDVQTDDDQSIHEFHGQIGDLKALIHRNRSIRIAFSAKVTPAGDILRANETGTPDVLVYDRLWVRHWDEWITDTKQSIFSTCINRSNGAYSLVQNPINMLNSSRDLHDLESPIPPFGGAGDFSLSETHLAFVSKDPHLNPATNTAAHVYVVRFNDSSLHEQVHRGSGASSSPVWSPDGKYLAYLEMRVAGYEADRPLMFGRTNDRPSGGLV